MGNTVREELCNRRGASGVGGGMRAGTRGHAVLFKEKVKARVRHRFCCDRLAALSGKPHEEVVAIHCAGRFSLPHQVP